MMLQRLSQTARMLCREDLIRALTIRQATSMAAIKALRERTGAPIKAVKDALDAQEGDPERALDHLRKLGTTLVAKRAHRQANDGVVAISIASDGLSGIAVELSSETDFVAKTEQFTSLASKISHAALAISNASGSDAKEVIRNLPVGDVLSIDNTKEKLEEAATALGEKIELRQVAALSVVNDGNRSVCGYVHRAVSQGCGKIGVLVAMEGSEKNLFAAGKRVAMHIAAAAPEYTRVKGFGGIPSDVISKEREILLEAARAEMKSSGKDKPDIVLQKVVDGRLRKWFQDVVLEEQEMLVEIDNHVGKPRSVSQSLQAEVGDARVLEFLRMEIGRN